MCGDTHVEDQHIKDISRTNTTHQLHQTNQEVGGEMSLVTMGNVSVSPPGTPAYGHPEYLIIILPFVSLSFLLFFLFITEQTAAF